MPSMGPSSMLPMMWDTHTQIPIAGPRPSDDGPSGGGALGAAVGGAEVGDGGDPHDSRHRDVDGVCHGRARAKGRRRLDASRVPNPPPPPCPRGKLPGGEI